MFDFDISDELKEVMIKLQKKDKNRLLIINKKIKEIISSNSTTIDHYKNLRHNLSNYKRVHIDKSFVLLFSVNKEINHILFVKLKHHDEVYTK
ncbi:MAG: type II toxin-antitoxin system RelE family toxin [Candidatus Woesearchaeota archaeon]